MPNDRTEKNISDFKKDEISSFSTSLAKDA